jgi:hypothetical protein
MNLTNPITADGDYDITVTPGKPLLFTLKGDFGGATVTMTVQDPTGGETFMEVEGGEWTEETEDTVTPPSGIIRLTVAGGTDSDIRASFTPVIY